MKLNEVKLTEGTDFICPGCDENLDKDTQLGTKVYCGNCGQTSNNEYGDDSE